MGSKLEISPYLFNHHYGFQQTLKYSPLLPVSEFGKFEITIIDQSDASLRNHTFGHGRTIETLTAPLSVTMALKSVYMHKYIISGQSTRNDIPLMIPK